MGKRFRFSLFALNVAIAVVAVLVGLLVQHGMFGLIFFVPFLAMLIGSTTLFRFKRPKWASALVAAYLGSWVVTVVFAPTAAEHKVCSILNDPQIVYLKSDPTSAGSYDGPDVRPWCFIGNYSVPCPFVVSLDLALQGRSGGMGERGYFIWCPGALWLARRHLHWQSDAPSRPGPPRQTSTPNR